MDRRLSFLAARRRGAPPRLVVDEREFVSAPTISGARENIEASIGSSLSIQIRFLSRRSIVARRRPVIASPASERGLRRALGTSRAMRALHSRHRHGTARQGATRPAYGSERVKRDLPRSLGLKQGSGLELITLVGGGSGDSSSTRCFDAPRFDVRRRSLRALVAISVLRSVRAVIFLVFCHRVLASLFRRRDLERATLLDLATRLRCKRRDEIFVGVDDKCVSTSMHGLRLA